MPLASTLLGVMTVYAILGSVEVDYHAQVSKKLYFAT